MTAESTLLLHTSHEPLARQICAVLDPSAQPVRAHTGDELLRMLRRQRAPVLLLDLFCEEARHGVATWMDQLKSAVIIALGDPRTEAARQAEAAGAFAVLEPSLTGLLALPALISRAAHHAHLQEETATCAPSPPSPPRPPPPRHRHRRDWKHPCPCGISRACSATLTIWKPCWNVASRPWPPPPVWPGPALWPAFADKPAIA